MKRNEIWERISKMVFDYYDYREGTLENEVWLTDTITATITKRQGSSPECEIYDGEGDGERSLPNVCAFIEAVVEECIADIVEQRNSPDYDREMFEEWCGGGWR